MAAGGSARQSDGGDARLFVGVDIGGTNIKLGLVNAAGMLLGRHAIPTPVEAGPAAGVERIAVAMDELLRKCLAPADRIAAVGVGIPGAVNSRLNTVEAPANLPGWGGFPICQRLAARVGRPAWLFNDAGAAAYGEFWVGVGRGFQSMVLLTLGTGLGGGVIVGRRLLEGEHGLGGELGHAVIDYNDNANQCSCGGFGHLEAYVGARGVVRRVEQRLSEGRPSSLERYLEGGAPLTPACVAAAAAAGDAMAEEITLETARLLGVGIVNALHAFDPGIVVLGGAMTFGGAASSLGQRFLAAARGEVRRRALAPLVDVPIEFAALGSDAGVIGAAGLAKSAFDGPTP